MRRMGQVGEHLARAKGQARTAEGTDIRPSALTPKSETGGSSPPRGAQPDAPDVLGGGARARAPEPTGASARARPHAAGAPARGPRPGRVDRGDAGP